MQNKYIVYIFISRKDSKLYVGCTSSLWKRLQRHLDGEVPVTKEKRPLDFLYYKVAEGKAEAFQKERNYKSVWTAHFKKIRLLHNP